MFQVGLQFARYGSWPQIPHLPSPSSQVIGLQACQSMSGSDGHTLYYYSLDIFSFSLENYAKVLTNHTSNGLIAGLYEPVRWLAQ